MLAPAIAILVLVILQLAASTVSSDQSSKPVLNKCRDESSIYAIDINSSSVVIENITCNDGYISIKLQLNESSCPTYITIIKRGVSFNLAVSSEGAGGRCLVLVSTVGISPLRLGLNESLIIDIKGVGQITVLRKNIINNTTTSITNQANESSVYIPNDTNEKGDEVRSNKMSSPDLSPVEIAGAIALLALTALAAVKEYGQGRKGN